MKKSLGLMALSIGLFLSGCQIHKKSTDPHGKEFYGNTLATAKKVTHPAPVVSKHGDECSDGERYYAGAFSPPDSILADPKYQNSAWLPLSKTQPQPNNFAIDSFNCVNGYWALDPIRTADNKMKQDEEYKKYLIEKEHKQNLYRALISRPLSKTEMIDVYKYGENIMDADESHNDQAFADQNEVELLHYKKYLAALYHQYTLQAIKSCHSKQ